MKCYSLSLILLLLSVSLIAQSQISGSISDENSKAIFFATVALYTEADSSLSQSISTDEDGRFQFRKLADGRYYLRANMLGYEMLEYSNIVLPADRPVELDLQLKEDAVLLSTVEVTERLPLLEQRADKIIVNVENNVTNTSGSLIDVMKKVPGMIVVNDQLSMAGAGTPTILIDGRSTQYMDVQSLLKDMPGENIKKVEIIHQPGAEYEAAGSGPILNIILKKNSLLGTNGSVRLGAGKGELWDYTSGLSLSHYAGKLNVSAGLGWAQNAYVEELHITRRLSNVSEAVDGTYTQLSRDAAKPRTYNANLRIDWDVHPQHRIGVETKYYDNVRKYTAFNDTDVELSADQYASYSLNTTNEHDRGWSYAAINPYYVFEIDSNGQKLALDFTLAEYQVEGLNTLTTTSAIDSGLAAKQRYNQPGKNEIMGAGLDYTRPLSKAVELKLGAKFSDAALDNDLQSTFLNEQGEWVNNELQSNHYLFDEQIYAGYGKLSWTSGPWSGTAGLRYENSESKGTSLTVDSTLNRRISKLFPSFSLSRKISEVLTAGVSYSYRIERPRYHTLNPFVYYLDPFTYEAGNPNIRPELTHSSKFTLSFEGQPFFNIEYKQSKDAIVEITSQESDSEEAYKTDINFDDRNDFSTSLFFPMEFVKDMGGYGGVIVANNRYNSQLGDAIFERSKWSVTTFMQVSYQLPWELKSEIGAWYTSGSQEGIFDSEHLFGTSLGISKKFLNNKAQLSLGVEDFVNRFWHANVDYQQDMDLVSTWQAPVVNARFSYKFGNQHLKSRAKHRGSTSEEIKRARVQ